MNEEAIRNVMADQMACGFIVELLLVDKLKSLPDELLNDYVDLMRKVGRRTDQLAGRVDDQTAELLADVTVKMHSALDGYLDRALARLEAGRAAAQ